MNTLTKVLILCLAIPSLILSTGCTTSSNAESGALTGAILGAVIGGAIGNNVESNNGRIYRGCDGYLYRDEDTGGAAGALIGAALGAMIGGSIGAEQDRRDAQMQADEMRLQRELVLRRQEEQAAHDAYRTQEATARGMTISDAEVIEAERRAREAEARLFELRRDRLEALKRDQRLSDAEARRLEAEMEIERLERELAGIPARQTSNGGSRI
jgi:surface antigen